MPEVAEVIIVVGVANAVVIPAVKLAVMRLLPPLSESTWPVGGNTSLVWVLVALCMAWLQAGQTTLHVVVRILPQAMTEGPAVSCRDVVNPSSQSVDVAALSTPGGGSASALGPKVGDDHDDAEDDEKPDGGMSATESVDDAAGRVWETASAGRSSFAEPAASVGCADDVISIY
jgi:hypothetical protein